MFLKCEIQNCGYRGDNGFCLNRVVVINEQGVCKYLTKPGWDLPVEDRFKSNYKAREPVYEKIETEPAEVFERFKLDDVCDW